MKRVATTSILMLLLPVISAYGADNWYAVTFLKNATSFDVNFRYRFGTRDTWHDWRLAQGERARFHFKYAHANQDRSPGVQILVDTDTKNHVSRHQFKLVAHACPDIGKCGTHYKFMADPSAHTLEMVREPS